MLYASTAAELAAAIRTADAAPCVSRFVIQPDSGTDASQPEVLGVTVAFWPMEVRSG